MNNKDIRISKINEVHLRIDSADSGILMEISEHFTFMVPGYRYMPSFRNKCFDGKIRIFNAQKRSLPYGLLFELLKFGEKCNYTFDIDKSVINKPNATREDLVEYADSLDITVRGNPAEIRDYQMNAFTNAILEGRCLTLSPTASGKSMMLYLIIRWYLANNDGKVIIIVPTTSLVNQMKKDFADYSSTDPTFDADSEIHEIYSGKEKFNIDSRIVCTTWQSAINLPKNWFLPFGMAICDEAHLAVAKSINTIMGNLINANYRIGTTGTLDGAKCNELVLIGNFGPVHKVITTKELMDADTIAQLKIKCIVLNHNQELKKLVSKLDYASEIDVIVSHKGRNDFITKLALDQKGNTLILFNLVVKHGKPLYKQISEAVAEIDPNRKVFYVSGEVKTDVREEIRAITETQTNAIICASSKCFAVGINIRNVHAIVFAAPNKSQIRVLQSIGRGLRKADNGEPTILYDISDNFAWKSKKNHTMNHAIHRINIYNREQFNYKIYEIELL